MNMKKCRKQKVKGFSLAEAMIATVVLAIAAAGVLLPFTSGARMRAEGARRTLAAKLAADLMEEIINTPFGDIIDQYGVYMETQGQVKDASETVFTDSNYANFSRKAACDEVYVDGESGDDEPKFIRATVRVYYDGAELAAVSRLIGNRESKEQEHMKESRRQSRGLSFKAFTLVELLVALMVTSIVLTAVATLAFAMGNANETSSDSSEKQARVRYASLRISELIRGCKLICGVPGGDLVIWRADDDPDDGKINPTELVYLEVGPGRDRLQLLDFSWSASWALTLSEIQDINTKDALILSCTARQTVLVPQCNNIRFVLDVSPPMTKFVSISFEVLEEAVARQCQINASLRCWAGYLLDGNEIVSSDDD